MQWSAQPATRELNYKTLKVNAWRIFYSQFLMYLSEKMVKIIYSFPTFWLL